MSTSQADIFINGKAQIFEMLGFMDASHRKTLLKNIQIRNPRLANELIEHCFSFDNFLNLQEQDIFAVTTRLPAAIIGMALKGTSSVNQRKVLEIMNRKQAEEAFEIMAKQINNENSTIRKAQNKIISTMISLYRNKTIDIFQN